MESNKYKITVRITDSDKGTALAQIALLSAQTLKVFEYIFEKKVLII
jgi:hypothetical protein